MKNSYKTKFRENYDENYTLALDIGTNSVGWAVLDEYNNIPTFKGNKSFGARIFEKGHTAENTRIKRGMRRRNRRKKQRIKYLNEIFQNEILKKYPDFFVAFKELNKLKENAEKSDYKNELTKLSMQKVLSYIDDEQKTNYLSEFPTMYHLRYKLMTTTEKVDIRLIYLALHHIVKKRGNFLKEGNFDIIELKHIHAEEVKVAVETICEQEGFEQMSISLSLEAYENFLEIVTNDELTINDKGKNVTKIDKRLKNFAHILSGGKLSLDKIFAVDLEEKTAIEFGNEDEEAKIEQILSEEQWENYLALKNIYTQIVFNSIIGGSDTLSEAKIQAYQEYRNDLNLLKAIVQCTPTYKRKLVKSSEKALLNWKEHRIKKEDTRCLVDRYQSNTLKTDEFYKELEKMLIEIEKQNSGTSKLIKKVLSKKEQATFMKKLNTTDNSAIPYQLNLFEAKKIMENQAKFYPDFFTEEVIDRVCKIIEFRIPYYIGPLSDKKIAGMKDFNWLVKKEASKIRPWNFSEVVDELQTAENFITRMLNSCTYLNAEYVLPKCSMYYQIFEVLNELNVLKINNKPITKVERDAILAMFLVRKPTIKAVEKMLMKTFNMQEAILSGMQQDKQFATSLSSVLEFEKLFNQQLSVKEIIAPPTQEIYQNIVMMENFILWKTVFPEGKILQQKIESEYPILNSKFIKKILQIKATGWGRLSQKLLLEVPPKNIELERSNILEILYKGVQTNEKEYLLNLQQILTREYFGYSEKIDKINQKEEYKDKIIYDDIANLAGSPALKRGIWQAVKLIEDIEGIFGKPKHIVIEMARSDEFKRRTISREKQVENWNKAKIFKGTTLEDDIKNKTLTYNNERVWLYILQKGHCMYTGAPLELTQLSNYQVDHIIPKSISNDDSIDNKVLVKSYTNQNKSDYMMPLEVINHLHKSNKQNIITMWNELKEKGLLSDKKYRNLMIPKLTEAKQESFINRQLVETRQITKHLIKLLEQKYNNTVKVVGVKAQLNDMVKRSLGIVKIRELNNKHHAVDAYMAGFIYKILVDKNKSFYVDGKLNWKDYRKKYNKNIKDKERFWIVNEINNNELIDSFGEVYQGSQGIYNFICKQIDDSRYTVSRKQGCFDNQDDRKFWKETLYPIKMNLKTNEYIGKQYLGKRSGVTYYAAALIMYQNQKNKLVKEIISIPIFSYLKNNEDIQKCVMEELADTIKPSTQVKIIYVLQKNQKIVINGYPYRFISHQENSRIIELNLLQQEQKLYFDGSAQVANHEQALEVIEKQIAFLRLMQKKLNTIFSEYYGKHLDIVNTSMDQYLQILNSITESNLEQKIMKINTEVIGKNKSINKNVKLADLQEITKLFKSYCVSYIFKIVKADSGRIGDWKYIGRLGNYAFSKINDFVAIEQSTSGLHEKKVILIKNGKVKGEDTWVFD